MHYKNKKLFAALMLACAAQPLFAQSWPSKPVRIIAANSAGAATDLAARVFADHFQRQIGQPATIENRPGADGYIGAQAVAQSAPDGYTLFFASQSVFALDPNIKKQMPVDPDRDFTPIAMMIDDTGAAGFFVHPSMPFNTMPEMIAYAKANPGKLTYATTVPLFGMIGEWVSHRAGVKLTEVRYKTTAQANQDAISGQVTMLLTAFGPFEQYWAAKRMKLLAVSRKVPSHPDIPTLSTFWSDFDQPTFIVLAGPGGMAPDLAQRINRAAAAVVESPKFNQDLEKVRWRNENGALTPQQTAAFIKTKRDAWARFVREIGMKPE